MLLVHDQLSLESTILMQIYTLWGLEIHQKCYLSYMLALGFFSYSFFNLSLIHALV